MRIDFSRVLRGERDLEGFFKFGDIQIVDPDYNPRLDMEVNYSLQGLDAKLYGELGKGLTERGMAPVLSNGGIWVQQPDQFSLRLNVTNFDTREFENMSHKIKSKFWKWEWEDTENYRREVPKVLVNGGVYFERIENVDPSRVLETLTSAGYKSSVKTTPEEVAEAMNRMKDAYLQARQTRTRRQTVYVESDSDSTGTIIGAGIGGAAGGIPGAIGGAIIGSLFD